MAEFQAGTRVCEGPVVEREDDMGRGPGCVETWEGQTAQDPRVPSEESPSIGAVSEVKEGGDCQIHIFKGPLWLLCGG